eukprot:TRINITY_DN2881_c0_g1_i1.p1 TRINITY_DN2881_c0_g1~~TRINITY_DN2881_c0_g1_i1.p1  ORF type:complete len:244 (+),score=63.40 TRINITY_DN2881_c0_g1_i1:75-734(+)
MDSSQPQEQPQEQPTEQQVGPEGAIFPPLSKDLSAASASKEYRKIRVPPNRFTPLKKVWKDIYQPLVEHMKLQVRMNPRKMIVEIRTSKFTKDPSAIQKGADFVQAFLCGFDVSDAIAILRVDDLYVDSFEIRDVKTLHGDHLSRAIGRVAGKDGKTKFAIENATRTRIVVADSKIHILGTFTNIKVARDSLVSLILGSPASKVYSKLRSVSSRIASRR